LTGYSFDLSNRTVLVTGASSGIGAQFARTLAASGAAVVLAARRADRLKALEAELKAAGARALAVAMDVADEASVQAGYDAAEKAFGGVDSVIANAGMSPAGSALGLSVGDFDQVTDVNIKGVFLTVREGARRMIAHGSGERGHGRILIVSSITAHYVSASAAAYSASKAAVLQLGRTLAFDWAKKGVNVNILCPGYILTELTDSLWDIDRGKALLERFPRRRLMDLATLDPLMLYLTSDASAQLTGSVFDVDDGQSLG
jgi:NAD(P)-dependent dehydrogenase (short-subunit alcohol dehydrogenase family)